MRDDIQSILLTEEEICRRVHEMGAEITRDYAGKAPLMVGILRGSVLFMADLVRRGFVCASADAYHLTYAPSKRERGDEQYKYRREQQINVRVHRCVSEDKVICIDD